MTLRLLIPPLLLSLLAGCLAPVAPADKHPLIGRKVTFAKPVRDDGSQRRPDIQTWSSDGTTLIVTDNWLFPALRRRKHARWWLAGARYCMSYAAYEASIAEMDKTDDVFCATMEVISGGKQVKFIPEKTGFLTAARIGDYLN